MNNSLEAKELKEQASIVDLLHHLGYDPVPKRGREKMYISMLRPDDTSPSFSVNDDLGVWFDHGTRKGGNIIDFGLAYWKNTNFNQVIKRIQEVLSLEPATQNKAPKRPRIAVNVRNYIVHESKALGTHPAITEYLKNRGIFEVARKHLCEVYYYIEDQDGERKHFFAAGWQNEKSGWEVRNKYFKGCIGHKGLSILPGHSKKAALFEGFINYLSWRMENPEADHTVIVLNTLALLHQGIERSKAYSHIDLFFDRDKAGFTATKEFALALPYASDRSAQYEGFNDYNDKLTAQLKNAALQQKNKGDFFAGIKVPFKR